MTKLNKKAWLELGISLGIFAILAVVSALWDLQINKALYHRGCLFGQYFGKLGEVPTYFAAPIIGAILFSQGWGKDKKLQVAFKALFGIVVFAGWFVAFGVWLWGRFNVTGAFEGSDADFDIVYKIVGAAGLTAATLFAAYKIPKATAKKLLWFAIFYLIVAVVANGAIAAVKELWARERFRVMFAIGDYSGYTPWYLPQGFATREAAYMEIREAADELLGHSGDAFKSFPSGHTGAAATLFAMIILPDMFPQTLGGKKKKIFWIVPIVYTVSVAISRLLMGAHYLSDVLFGGFIGYGAACLIRWIFVSKIKNLNQEPELVASFDVGTEAEPEIVEDEQKEEAVSDEGDTAVVADGTEE